MPLFYRYSVPTGHLKKPSDLSAGIETAALFSIHVFVKCVKIFYHDIDQITI